MSKTPERIRLAEEWRVAGKKLRERSPQLFSKLFEMIAVLATRDEEEETDTLADTR
jgi:hypothetical protein